MKKIIMGLLMFLFFGTTFGYKISIVGDQLTNYDYVNHRSFLTSNNYCYGGSPRVSYCRGVFDDLRGFHNYSDYANQGSWYNCEYYQETSVYKNSFYYLSDYKVIKDFTDVEVNNWVSTDPNYNFWILASLPDLSGNRLKGPYYKIELDGTPTYSVVTGDQTCNGWCDLGAPACKNNTTLSIDQKYKRIWNYYFVTSQDDNHYIWLTGQLYEPKNTGTGYNNTLTIGQIAQQANIGVNDGEISFLLTGYDITTSGFDYNSNNLLTFKGTSASNYSIITGYYFIYSTGIEQNASTTVIKDVPGNTYFEYKTYDCVQAKISDYQYCNAIYSGTIGKYAFFSFMRDKDTLLLSGVSNTGLLLSSNPDENYWLPTITGLTLSNNQDFLQEGITQDINIGSGSNNSGNIQLNCSNAQNFSIVISKDNLTGGGLDNLSGFDFSGSNGRFQFQYNFANNKVELPFTHDILDNTIPLNIIKINDINDNTNIKPEIIETSITSNSIKHKVIFYRSGKELNTASYKLGTKLRGYIAYNTILNNGKYNLYKLDYKKFSDFSYLDNICSIIGGYNFYDLLYLYASIGTTPIYKTFFNEAKTIDKGLSVIEGTYFSGTQNQYAYIVLHYYWINKSILLVGVEVGQTDDKTLNTASDSATDAEFQSSKLNNAYVDGNGGSMRNIFNCDTDNDGYITAVEVLVCPRTIGKNTAVAVGQAYDKVTGIFTTIGGIQGVNTQGSRGSGGLPQKISGWSNMFSSPANSTFPLISKFYALVFGLLMFAVFAYIIIILNRPNSE